jgi:sugar/nucleoside kinase (ribokinase family)
MELINKSFDIIFCNQQEAYNISSSDNINDSIRFLSDFSNEIVITSGNKGAYVYYDAKITHVKVRSVTPVDLTGAGDMFLAAYLLSKRNNKTITESIDFANKCAGRIIQKYGAKFDSEEEYTELKSNL